MRKEPYYDPKPTRYPFPDITDQHYLKVKKDNGTVFDANYPYIDKSKGFLRKKKMIRLLLRTIVFPVLRIKLGLRIRGKENVKNYRDVLDKGAVIVSNHVHMWDYLAILCALKRPNIAVVIWERNIRGEYGPAMRLVGGIPIPEGDYKATNAFMKAVDTHLQEGNLLQIYAEGSMWEYYKPIRPFKTGPAFFASRNDKPILPIAFSYRKAGWLRKLFGQLATFTIHIGEPLYINKDIEGKDAQIDLITRAHDAVCRLAGIDPKDNPYPPVFHNDHRVDYY